MQQLAFFVHFTMMQKVMVTATMALLLSGCSTGPTKMEQRGGYYVNRAFTAIGQNERIRFLVMHYTALDDSRSLQALTKNQVSVYYLIPQEPQSIHSEPVVLQLVDENKRAWHAGVSNWNGRAHLNDASIGIEIVKPGYTDDMLGQRTQYPCNEKQIAAVALLAKDIINRYQLTPENVVEHNDIAPLEKQDPGKLFPWERLAAMGIGASPDKSTVVKYLAGRSPSEPAEVSVIQALLKQYGYDMIPQNGILDEDTCKTISAFQMHFRSADISGNADAETEAIAPALNEKYRATPLASQPKGKS